MKAFEDFAITGLKFFSCKE